VDKKKQKILIWVLTWAGLLLVVLYSPLGSPELFNQNSYYVVNQVVVSNGGEVVNFPTARRSSGNGGGYQAINIPEYATTSQSRMYSYSVSTGGKTMGSSATYSPAVSSFSNSFNRSSGGGSMSGGGSEGFYSNSNNSKNRNNIPQGTGLLSLSTDLNLLANNTNRQFAGAGLNTGATDPGGDPTGDPIPVGDGWIFLLILATGYAMWRIKSTIN
jgi:hypothetical protein